MNPKSENNRLLYLIAGVCLFLVALAVAVTVIIDFVPTYDARYGDYDSRGEAYDIYLPDYVKVCDYKKIRLPKISYQVTDQDVANKLTNYQSMYCTSNEDPDRECQNGDIVNIITECKFTDNDGIYGLFTFKKNSFDWGQAYVLGINYFGVPELDDEVRGMKAGETKTVKFNLPDPFYKDILNSGREVELTVNLVYIDEINYGEVNDHGGEDSFYEEYYGYDKENFMVKISYDLQKEYSEMLKDYKVQLSWNYVCDNSRIKKLPEDILQKTYDDILDYARGQAMSADKTLEEYVVSQGYDGLDDYFSYAKEKSEQTVYEDMLLYYVIRCERLTLPEDYYKEQLLDMAKDYQINDFEQAEDFYDYYYGIDKIKEEILKKYAQQWIADNAEVVDDVTTVYNNKLGLKPTWQD